MKKEMDDLCEEILDKKREGEVVLFMDANAKIGMLNENISRNGRYLLNVVDECDLEIINKSDVCKGTVTRVNRKNPDERSAIDYVIATNTISSAITEMIIDEDGKYLLHGKAPTDHNSIILGMEMNSLNNQRCQKVTKWRLSAPEEQWKQFRQGLDHLNSQYGTPDNPTEQMTYEEWQRQIENVAFNTIGKTTVKLKSRVVESKELKALRKEKREARKSYEIEVDPVLRKNKLDLYFQKQRAVKSQIEKEQNENVKRKLEKIADDSSGLSFWNECRRQKKDEMNSWTAVKDKAGKRILEPEAQKSTIAGYCQDLYSPDPTLPQHPYHQVVIEKMEIYQNDYTYDHLPYNEVPSIQEVEQVIENKKNNKSTTDLPNEMLKRGGRPFLERLYPLIKEFWEKEIAHAVWNKGLITLVFKGKGDRESLNCQRGITVSSTISMICEELINNRMTQLVPLSQAQGGGKKGSSTRDHIFVLRGAIAMALKHKRDLYVTFYDVSKAYDRADVHDMLTTIWDHGMKGKCWRLLKELNTNLTAQIKTRHGLTEEITRLAGGKQGGKNFGFLFAKMMDLLQEEADENPELGVYYELLKLIFLIWVDDVVSFAEGEPQQNLTLAMVNEFAIKHKLKWGSDKCNVMHIGTNAYVEKTWKLGSTDISSCENYKYLGDIIMRNNGNQKNIEDRENKVKMVTRKIISMCSSDVLNKMEVWPLLKLHETRTIPTLLANAETWVMGKEDRKKLERIELWALKHLFGLPPTTPTLAVRVITGTLFTSQRIDEKQLKYLKVLLHLPENDWPKMSLMQQKTENIYWAKQIQELLQQYDITESWDEIRSISFAEWKRKVNSKIEEKYIQRIKEGVGSLSEQSKTKFIEEIINCESFKRAPLEHILKRSKMGARALIMGISGMLDCAKNFHFKYKTKICKACHVLDDEDHRINSCKLYASMNLYYSHVKFDFSCIFSNEKQVLDKVEHVILSLWDLTNGKNKMKTIE